MNYGECYKIGVLELQKAEVQESALDARLLLEYVCGTDRNTLLVHPERIVTQDEYEKYIEVIKTRASRIPLQHITNVQNFMGLDFFVNENVLIPRQDTEVLVEEVLKNLHDGMRVLDMCTGSGCILTSLLKYSNNCLGVGVDISKDAISVALSNARSLLENAYVCEKASIDVKALEEEYADKNTTATFVNSNLFEHIYGKFDIIVSNPPYIETSVIETLEPEVRKYEPILALDGDRDGLKFYRSIIEGSLEHLYRGGMLFFEIGFDQGESVKKLMENAGYKEVEVYKDYAGLDRVVYGYLLN